MDASSCLREAAKPARLMRIELSSVCDYNCRFCCWQNNAIRAPYRRIAPDQTAAFCRALVKSGCHNVNITGGEPLMLPLDYLCDTVKAIRSVDGINQLWITTNGAALREDGICRSLSQAGLAEAAVSIAAETDEKYSLYTGTDNTLEEILSGIRNAVRCGIAVRVHIPLNPVGISDFAQLEKLLDKIEDAGVFSAFYFRLNNGEKIESRFEELLVDTSRITAGFESSPRWRYGETESVRPYYTDGRIRVNVPRESIRLFTENCKSRNCGAFCQGIYSAYLAPDDAGWKIRACHRVFSDGNNEYRLDEELLMPEKEEKLLELLHSVWRYAYDER